MTGRWYRRGALVLLLACGGLSAKATTDAVDTCFARNDAAGLAACRSHTASIAGNAVELRAFGFELELAGGHEQAALVYSEAIKAHGTDRQLLQGLIRVRREAKALALVTAPPLAARLAPAHRDQDLTDCYHKRWYDALGHCQSALASHGVDARLHERHGDVLRSVGRPRDALAAYGHSLELDSSHLATQHKRRSLAALLGETPRQLAAASPAPAVLRTPDDAPPPKDPAPSAPAPIVEKLELLQDLLARGLIDQSEFAQRRGVVLGNAFGEDTTTAPPAVKPAGKYRALVIGNNSYRDFVELKTPGADARGVAAVLRNRYGFETKTLLNATRYEILKALSAVRSEVGEADSLLIYYAGHGYLDPKTKRGYWLPVDAERDNFANWISTNDVTDTLAGVAARHAIVVADSCFSGTLLRDILLPQTQPRQRLLQQLASKRSRTVLTSGGLEPVLDDGDGKHSVFARAFLDTLRENQDVLEAGRLFVTVRDRVLQNADQTPQYAPLRNAGHEGGDFIFVRQ